ncbi:hypothetical protein OGW02_11255 [Citrobacter sp. Ce105]|uniref:DUF7167 family protein n=1 Tax=Citrobacter sp. Ce105 TaxID=2985041 RepID=UPI002575A0E1|nr:hypothetical protein [Citrobacter sp. Ce105]MDM3290215.1 hypothetical protein [Citrobacter sp. Ce105]
MTRKFKVLLDSGANCKSARVTEITLDDIGIEESEWDSMPEKEKDEVMKDIAFETLEWYWEEI